jgi:hypothetical protein
LKMRLSGMRHALVRFVLFCFLDSTNKCNF